MSGGARFVLVVTDGPDVGSRLALDETPRVIGRARDAALPLTDPTTSRRHLEVLATATGAIVRTVPGASPFAHEGRTETNVALAPRGTVAIGSTILTLVEEAPPVAGDLELTDVRRLLDGRGADVRGLGAVFTLVEELDGADRAEPEQLLERVATWSRTAVGAIGVRVVEDAASDPALAPLARGEIVVLASGTGCSVVVPAPTSATAGVAFDLSLASSDLSLTLRRMLVVAARVFASKLATVRDVANARKDNELFRAQSVGSARAFLGGSPAALEVARLLPRLAASEATVLILGESGVGKTFVARLVHEASARAREPLRVVNCAAIPENLVESELFGHERGAFTGADAARAGVFEAAGRGTVLLDEIGELPLASQAKLLRVLEDRVFERVGGHRTIPLRARILAATNRDLEGAIARSTFRGDLFFRVSVVSIRIPALRERGDDIVMLSRRLLADLASGAGRRVRDFQDDALAVLRSYSWPGNVRELRNAIEHALVLGEGPLVRAIDLPPSIRAALNAESAEASTDGDSVRLPARLEWLEARAIEAALKSSGGNRTRAAAILGINRVTLYKKLKEPTE